MSATEISQVLEAEERLATKLESFAGQWVAIRDHDVVCNAETLGELLERVNTPGIDRILEVSDEPAAACFF